jgi:isocitrate/isopropylmalate dehydrogenase
MGCRWTTRQGLLHFQRPSWVCRTGSSSWRALQAHRRDPDSALEEFKKFDSIFLGAIGHPDVKPGILEVGILLKTRFALDQYINLRPVKLYPNVETPLKDKGPEHIDFVVVRENTGGIYTGIGGVTQKGTPLEVATQVMQYSRPVVGSRGEPPSSARRVPSREGMETLPGFPS